MDAFWEGVLMFCVIFFISLFVFLAIYALIITRRSRNYVDRSYRGEYQDAGGGSIFRQERIFSINGEAGPWFLVPTGFGSIFSAKLVSGEGKESLLKITSPRGRGALCRQRH